MEGELDIGRNFIKKLRQQFCVSAHTENSMMSRLTYQRQMQGSGSCSVWCMVVCFGDTGVKLEESLETQ